MVPAPPIIWKGAHPNNFTVGRPGGSRDGRSTKHWIVGTLASADATFKNPARYATAHFGVGPNGIHQYVNIKDTAWSDGNWDSNLRTISVEHEGGPSIPLTAPMYAKAAWLHAWLKENYGVKYSIRHNQVYATQCPGTLDLARIEREANALIEKYSKPAAQPEWLKNRKAVKMTVYSQISGLRLINLADPSKFADARSFARNTSFEIGSQTTVKGVKYFLTKSSTDANLPNGIRATEVSTTPWAPPIVTPPQPTTPKWDDSLVDDPNKSMYVLRETLLINLETGKPALDSKSNEIRFKAGDIIKDISAHVIILGTTYYLTEYSFSKRIARGIKSDDLSLNPQATPIGTPANPDPSVDVNWLRAALNGLIEAIKVILNKLPGGN